MNSLEEEEKQKIICEFCERIFSNRHNLKIHQSTARYCLQKRPSNVETEEEKEGGTSVIVRPNYPCEQCKKMFTSKQTLLYHKKICKKVLTHEIREYYTKQIAELNNRHDELVATLREKIKTLEKRINVLI